MLTILFLDKGHCKFGLGRENFFLVGVHNSFKSLVFFPEKLVSTQLSAIFLSLSFFFSEMWLTF